MKLHKDLNFILDLEPENFMFARNSEYVVPVEVCIYVEYDEDNGLEEDFRTMKVFIGERNVLGQFTLSDYQELCTMVSNYITANSNDIIEGMMAEVGYDLLLGEDA